NGTSLNFTVTSNGQISVSDTIAGGGEVQKLGMGELILTGANTYTGATTVDAGRLAINGSVTSNVTVNNGGTLGGSGDITGNLLNDGIIAPGNSIGTLNVNGEFSLNPSSQLEIEINAAGQSDLITASGYTILDGTVNVKAAPGAYTNGQSYTFLIYTGNRSGGFSGIYDDLAFFDAVLQYGAQDVSFSLQQNANDFGDVARTFNQISVATVFDNNTGSVLQPLADEMLYMTNEQVCHALDQLSGELYATNVQTQIQNTTNQMQMLAQHLRPALRVGGYESGVAAAPTLPSSELLVGFDRGGELVIRGQSDSAPRYTAWGNGYGLGGSARTDGNAAGLGYTLGGMQVGVERWLDEGSLAGLYGGYNYAQLNGRELTQRVQANSGQFGGYYRRDDGCDYYLVASGLSFDAYDSSRAIGIGAFNATAEANYDGWQSATYLERGRTHHVGATTLQPYAALQYIYLRQNSLSETGGGVANLDVAGVDAGSLRGSLGGRASREFTTQRGLVLVPQVRAAWLHEFLETNTLINNRFGALGGGSFAVQGLDMGRDWALLGTGLGWHLTEQLTLTGNYDAQANANQVFHVGSANVQYVW
ncbi:MAG TPA: autotransporter domain-containing protein, partial [Pirellulaceae bacterium]|nr:autotransporter domain-containing protein [Pirellulaceae bacterium]